MANSAELKKIVILAWDSYKPLFRAIHAGRATPATYAELDRLMLEDYPEFLAHTGKAGFMLFWIMAELFKLSRSNQAQDQLYDAISYYKVMHPLLSLRVLEKDHPALVAVGNREASTAAAQQERKRFKGYMDQMHNWELYPAVYEDLANTVVTITRERQEAFLKKIRERCATYKEDLMAAAWHPRRVQSWLDAGIPIEELVD